MALYPHTSHLSDQAQRVLVRVVSLIEQRRYEPGERLPSEREFAERLEVGRGVVREAFSSLESLRYIERRPNSGVFLGRDAGAVSLEALVLTTGVGLPLSREVLEQSLEVRRIIESHAVRLACERRTDDDLVALEKIVQEWDDSLREGRPVADLDMAFHMGIFRAAKNQIFERLVTPFYIMSAQRRDVFLATTDIAVESNAQHKRLLAAVRAQDVEEASRLMANHIGRVESSFGVQMRTQGTSEG